MSRKRRNPDQIVAALREADALLNAGQSVAAVIQHLGVSEATYHRWRNQYGGMKAEEAKRLKELESENVRLKRLSGLLVERCGGLWIASNRGNFCMLRTGDR